jgi:hypothetical protein
MKNISNITGVVTRRELLYLRAFTIVFSSVHLALAQDEVIWDNDVIFDPNNNQNNSGLLATNGSITLEYDVHIHEYQAFEFLSTNKISIKPGVRFDGHVRLAVGACGFLGGTCCSTEWYPCSNGLTCSSNNTCEQNATGFVAYHWASDHSQSLGSYSYQEFNTLLNDSKNQYLERGTEDPADQLIPPPLLQDVTKMCVAFPAMRNPENHIQGINRIPGLFEGRSAIVRTMDDKPGNNSQVFLTDLGFTGNDGYAFVSGSDSDDNLKKTRLAINNGIQHPGGLSVVGQYVAVGNQAVNEEEGSTVDIYDFSEDNVEKLMGNNATCDTNSGYTSKDAYTRLFLNSIKGLNDMSQNPLPAAEVSAAAIGRLASGRYILAVEGKSSGETREFWIYITKHRKLRDTGWIDQNWIFNNYFQINSRKAGGKFLSGMSPVGSTKLFKRRKREYRWT